MASTRQKHTVASKNTKYRRRFMAKPTTDLYHLRQSQREYVAGAHDALLTSFLRKAYPFFDMIYR